MSGIHEVRGAIHGKNYVLVRPLVEGTGAVFEARHDHNSGTYVVRLFPSEIHSRSETSLRIQGGARLSSLLRHPGIAQVLDFSVTGEDPAFVVTEYVPGRSLEDAMAEDGMLPPALAIDIVGQVVEALRAAHAMGIVHGDLHPGAIRLTKDARGRTVTKLLGFGWGRELRASGRRSGGWTYVAPEQLVPGAQRIDERADQFSLAAIVYEMLAGCSPFSEESTDLADPEARRYRTPPPVAQMVLGLPAGLDDVLRRALSYDPRERFPRLQDFASALERVAGATAPAVSTTRVTWGDWPAPVSLRPSGVPNEIFPTPPPVSDVPSFAISENTDAGQPTLSSAGDTPAAERESLASDSVLNVKDEDSDGVPVPLAAVAAGSIAPNSIELEDEGDEEQEEHQPPSEGTPSATEIQVAGEQAPILLQAAGTTAHEESQQAPGPVHAEAVPNEHQHENQHEHEDVQLTPSPLLADAIPHEDVQLTPSPVLADAISHETDHQHEPEHEDVQLTPSPVLADAISHETDHQHEPEDVQQTPGPLHAEAMTKQAQYTPRPLQTEMAPHAESDRTPVPLEDPATTLPNEPERIPAAIEATGMTGTDAQTPVPIEAPDMVAANGAPEAEEVPAQMAAAPGDGEEAFSEGEDAALAWIMSERPQTTASGVLFSSSVDPTPAPIAADDSPLAREDHPGPSLGTAGVSASQGMILSGAGAWRMIDGPEPVLSPLLQPVVTKPRALTRVLFVAATLAVVLGAVSVMSGMRDKISEGEAGAARLDSEAHSVAAAHRPPPVVNAIRVPTQVSPVPMAPTTTPAPKAAPPEPAAAVAAAGPVVVPTVAQAAIESRSDRTRPQRGHSRRGASRAGGRRDHRGR